MFRGEALHPRELRPHGRRLPDRWGDSARGESPLPQAAHLQLGADRRWRWRRRRRRRRRGKRRWGQAGLGRRQDHTDNQRQRSESAGESVAQPQDQPGKKNVLEIESRSMSPSYSSYLLLHIHGRRQFLPVYFRLVLKSHKIRHVHTV